MNQIVLTFLTVIALPIPIVYTPTPECRVHMLTNAVAHTKPPGLNSVTILYWPQEVDGILKCSNRNSDIDSAQIKQQFAPPNRNFGLAAWTVQIRDKLHKSKRQLCISPEAIRVRQDNTRDGRSGLETGINITLFFIRFINKNTQMFAKHSKWTRQWIYYCNFQRSPIVITTAHFEEIGKEWQVKIEKTTSVCIRSSRTMFV